MLQTRLSILQLHEQGYKPADEPASQYQTIPMNKIEDFGVHCQSYYSLDISYFKSELDSHMLDLLWNKYWVNTLSSSPLLATRDLATGQMQDIGLPLFCLQYISLVTWRQMPAPWLACCPSYS